MQSLYDILKSVQAQKIHQWADGSDCQFNALANAVLEGLHLWPFALDIVRLLGK